MPIADALRRTVSPVERLGDVLFRGTALAAAAGTVVLFLGLFVLIGGSAISAFAREGVGPVTGALRPQLWGTLVTSVLGVGAATVCGLAVAIVLTQGFLPAAVGRAIGTLVELLAAIPSVVYGLWGLTVVIPVLVPPSDWLHAHLAGIPLFGTPPLGPGVLPASVVLAVMILPTVAAVSRSALLSVDPKIRDAALALGATRWETVRRVILPAAADGIVGAVVLGFGRALGETMALAMLVGNSPTISWSLFAPADTLATMLANRFPEAGPADVSRLMAGPGPPPRRPDRVFDRGYVPSRPNRLPGRIRRHTPAVRIAPGVGDEGFFAREVRVTGWVEAVCL
jgi:phosphate transport system permease protein